MSTVLWANQLVNGEVVGENEDYYALYKHGKRIDAICKDLKLRPLTSFCDLTDVKFNNNEFELPPGATSTNDVMKVSGVWIDGKDAHEILYRVLQAAKMANAKFNFLVVQ